MNINIGQNGIDPRSNARVYMVKGPKGDQGDVSKAQLDAVQSQINSLASGSPLVASSVSGMTNTSRVYVNTSNGYWYYYNGSNWEQGGVYQATSDPEVENIRISEDGNTYSSAGNSVRDQIKNLKKLNNIGINTLNNEWSSNKISLSSDLFEIGGINSNNGENVNNITNAIRTRGYLTFDEIFKYLYIKSNTKSINNLFVLSYGLDGTFAYSNNIKNNIPFSHLSSSKKFRLVLVDDDSITSVSATLSKFEFTLVSYIKKENDVFEVENLNLINTNYVSSGIEVNQNNCQMSYNGSINSGIVVPIEPNTQYYCDNPNFYSAFFDKNQNLIGGVHYTGNDPLSSPFTTPQNAYYMLKVFRTADVGVSAFISKSNRYYDFNSKKIIIKSNIINKDTIEKTNPLNEKIIDLFGDSITSTDYDLPYWGQIISNNTGCIINNYGISGTTLAHTNDRHLWDYHFGRLDANEIGYNENDVSTWGSGNCFCERFSKVDSNADAIVIMGGTNDNNVPIGTWDSEDTSTFYGALNVLLQGISNRMAGKKILVCTPIQVKTSYSSNIIDSLSELKSKNSNATLSLQLRAEAIKQKCRQYGIHCLDLYNESGINGIDENSVYYRDSTHPSNIGQQRLANLIQNELEKLF